MTRLPNPPFTHVSEDCVIADADRVSPREFFRAVFGDPNDVSIYPQVAGYYLKAGAWFQIQPHHITERLTETRGDPLLRKDAA